MRENFLAETKQLLEEIEPEIWKNAAGISAEYFPWHQQYWLAIRLDGEDPENPTSWKYYDGHGDGKHIQEEFTQYMSALKYANDKASAHLVQASDIHGDHLTELADVLMMLDYSKYTPRLPVLEDGTLNPEFLLQVVDPDNGYCYINFCDDEDLIARRLKLQQE